MATVNKTDSTTSSDEENISSKISSLSNSILTKISENEEDTDTEDVISETIEKYYDKIISSVSDMQDEYSSLLSKKESLFQNIAMGILYQLYASEIEKGYDDIRSYAKLIKYIYSDTGLINEELSNVTGSIKLNSSGSTISSENSSSILSSISDLRQSVKLYLSEANIADIGELNSSTSGQTVSFEKDSSGNYITDSDDDLPVPSVKGMTLFYQDNETNKNIYEAGDDYILQPVNEDTITIYSSSSDSVLTDYSKESYSNPLSSGDGYQYTSLLKESLDHSVSSVSSLPSAPFAWVNAGTYLYILGGNSGNTIDNNIYQIDTESGEFVSLSATMPDGVTYYSTADSDGNTVNYPYSDNDKKLCKTIYYNGKIYLFDGINFNIYVFDISEMSDSDYTPDVDSTLASVNPQISTLSFATTYSSDTLGDSFIIGGFDSSGKMNLYRYVPSTESGENGSLYTEALSQNILKGYMSTNDYRGFLVSTIDNSIYISLSGTKYIFKMTISVSDSAVFTVSIENKYTSMYGIKSIIGYDGLLVLIHYDSSLFGISYIDTTETGSETLLSDNIYIKNGSVLCKFCLSFINDGSLIYGIVPSSSSYSGSNYLFLKEISLFDFETYGFMKSSDSYPVALPDSSGDASSYTKYVTKSSGNTTWSSSSTLSYLGKIESDKTNLWFSDNTGTSASIDTASHISDSVKIDRSLVINAGSSMSESIDGTLYRSSKDSSSYSTVFAGMITITYNGSTATGNAILEVSGSDTKSKTVKMYLDSTSSNTIAATIGSETTSALISASIFNEWKDVSIENNDIYPGNNSTLKMVKYLLVITDYLPIVYSTWSSAATNVFSEAYDYLYSCEDDAKDELEESLIYIESLCNTATFALTIFQNANSSFSTDYIKDMEDEFTTLQSTISTDLSLSSFDVSELYNGSFDSTMTTWKSTMDNYLEEFMENCKYAYNIYKNSQQNILALCGSGDNDPLDITTSAISFSDIMNGNSTTTDISSSTGLDFQDFDVTDYDTWISNLKTLLAQGTSSTTESSVSTDYSYYNVLGDYDSGILYMIAAAFKYLSAESDYVSSYDCLEEFRANILLNAAMTGAFNGIGISGTTFGTAVTYMKDLRDTFGITDLSNANYAILNPMVLKLANSMHFFNDSDIETSMKTVLSDSSYSDSFASNFPQFITMSYSCILDCADGIGNLYDSLSKIFYDSDNAKFREMSIRDLIVAASFYYTSFKLLSNSSYFELTSDEIKEIKTFDTNFSTIYEHIMEYSYIYSNLYYSSTLSDNIPSSISSLVSIEN